MPEDEKPTYQQNEERKWRSWQQLKRFAENSDPFTPDNSPTRVLALGLVCICDTIEEGLARVASALEDR